MITFVIRITVLGFLFFSVTEDQHYAATNDLVQKEHSLNGSWRITEIHWHTKDTTYAITNAQPGYILFSDEAYALMWTRTRDPRTPFHKLSEPTSEEIIAAFQSVVFNAGTYRISNDTLTTKAAIAKVPGFEGGRQFYTFKQSNNDQLYVRMFDEIYPNGDHPDWFGVFELAFHLERYAN